MVFQNFKIFDRMVPAMVGAVLVLAGAESVEAHNSTIESTHSLHRHISFLSSSGMSENVVDAVAVQPAAASYEEVVREVGEFTSELASDLTSNWNDRHWLDAINQFLKEEHSDWTAKRSSSNGELELVMVTAMIAPPPADEDTSGAGGTCTDSGDSCTTGTCTNGNDCTKIDKCTKHSNCTVHDNCTSGGQCTKNNGCTFSNWCTVNDEKCTNGANCTKSDHCTEGSACTFGDGCTAFGGCSSKGGCTKGKYCSKQANCTGGGLCSDATDCTTGADSCTQGNICSSSNIGCTSKGGCTAAVKCSYGHNCTSWPNCSTRPGCTQGTGCTGKSLEGSNPDCTKHADCPTTGGTYCGATSGAQGCTMVGGAVECIEFASHQIIRDPNFAGTFLLPFAWVGLMAFGSRKRKKESI